MNKQRLWTGLAASAGMLVLILDGRTALEGAREGIDLCLRTVIPSLFPFFLLSILLTGSFMGINFPILRPIGTLFGLPKGTESMLIPAFLGGYPAGAQSIGRAFRVGQIDKQTAQRLLAFCSNAGPAFLFGMTGSMFPQKWMVWALWGIHVFSAFLVSGFFPCGEKTCSLSMAKPVGAADAMMSALSVMGSVCGWVVVFRVIIAFLNRWFLWILPQEVQVTVMGLLELSNGCCGLFTIESIRLRFVICACILAAGGLCVTMQTLSVTEGLSLKHYFIGKGLQTLFSLLLSASVWIPWLLIPCVLVYFLLMPRKMRKNSRNPAALGV